jgi:hypothetical protein
LIELQDQLKLKADLKEVVKIKSELESNLSTFKSNDFAKLEDRVSQLEKRIQTISSALNNKKSEQTIVQSTDDSHLLDMQNRLANLEAMLNQLANQI